LAESEYGRFLTDRSYAKTGLRTLREFAELFPAAFPWAIRFGFTEPSINSNSCVAAFVWLKAYGLYHRTHFVMPYMTGRTQDVDQALS